MKINWCEVIAYILMIGLPVVLLIALTSNRDYHARQHQRWKGLYVEKHCVGYSRDEEGDRFCVCFDDEACAKTISNVKENAKWKTF